METLNITIFGAGAWGTAMAIHCARLGHNTYLVPRREEHASLLQADRETKDYLAGYPFPDNLQITANTATGIKDSDLVLLACPSKGLRELCLKIKKHLPEQNSIKAFLTLCKGLEQSTLKTPVTVANDVLNSNNCGVFSGPTFAGEVAEGKPTAITLAAHVDEDTLKSLQGALSSPEIRVYTSTDVNGVEYASCLKNIYAIGAGICDGLKLGDNAKASYLTRALNELVKLGTALGGHTGTFYGLSGFGDLVATCSGRWSRNRTFGQEIAEDQGVKQLLENRKTVVEGYWATKCFHDLVKQKHVDAPILREIHEVLYNEKKPAEALHSLMTRNLKAEIGSSKVLSL